MDGVYSRLGFCEGVRVAAQDPVENGYSGRVKMFEVADGDEVFHYTDVSGFRGIVSSGCLWATSTLFTNDELEVLHGMDILRKSLREHYESGKRMSPDIFISSLLENPPQVGVTCFTELMDDLSQWRAYGGAAGYSLGFRRPVDLSRVHYIDGRVLDGDADREQLMTQKVIDSLDEFFKEFVDAGGLEGELDNEKMKALYPILRKVNGRVASSLYAYGALSKHPAFSSEKELRLIVPLGWGRSMFPGVKFRESGWLVPYMEVGLGEEAGRLPLTRVMVGPSRFAETHRRSARMFLDSFGYEDVEVEISGSPFRR